MRGLRAIDRSSRSPSRHGGWFGVTRHVTGPSVSPNGSQSPKHGKPESHLAGYPSLLPTEVFVLNFHTLAVSCCITCIEYVLSPCCVLGFLER